MYKFLNSKKGFSLVELLIIVTLIAILTAVAVPVYNSIIGKGQAKVCDATRLQMQTEGKNWCMHNNFNDNFVYYISSDGENFTILDANKNPTHDLDVVHPDGARGCPSGGLYTVTVVPQAGGIPKLVIECDCEGHGD